MFASRINVAIGTLRAVAQRGLRHTVAVVGFDDFPLADLVEPGLTVVRQDRRQIGDTAVQMLFKRLDGNRSPPRHVMHTPTLIPRGSGEIGPTFG